MASYNETLYDVSLFIEGTPVLWSTDIEVTFEYEADKVKTNSGKITVNDRNPGVSLDITKHTKFNAEQENNFIKAVKQLAIYGGVVSVIIKEPNATLFINAYECVPDEDSLSHSPGELLEQSLSLVGSRGEYYYVDSA